MRIRGHVVSGGITGFVVVVAVTVTSKSMMWSMVVSLRGEPEPGRVSQSSESV